MSDTPTTTLLVIEDSLGDARLLREMLSEPGLHNTQLMHVQSLAEAELHLARYPVDVILLDLGLPDAQGFEAVQRAHAAAPRVPLVVLTGLDDESLATQALKEGAQDYLVKGQIETRGLLRAVRYAIERKAMEEALCVEKEQLQQSESRYRMIFDSASDGILLLDRDNRVIGGNRKLSEMTGRSENDSLGINVTDFLAGESERSALVLDGLSSGEELRRNRVVRRSDGSEFRAEISARRLEDGSALYIIRDVEANAEAQDLLQKSEQRYRGLFENAPDIIFDVGSDGVVKDLNPAFETLTGWAASRFIGKPFIDLIAPESKELAVSTFQNRADSEAEGFRDYRIFKADGTKMDVQINSRVEQEDGKPDHIVGWGRDVTALRRAQDESQELEGRLEQQRRIDSLGKLATQIAHEFNNLLMGVSTAVERIEKSKGGNDFLTAPLAVLNQAVQRGKSITQEILRFSRTVKPALSRIDLSGWIETLRGSLSDLCGPGIEIQVTAPAISLWVNADVVQLEQVFVNLAANARDAMDGKGLITITLQAAGSESEGHFVKIVFADTGAGVAVEHMSQLFNPMFTTKRHGTGLGLAIIHQIVTAHHGWIGADSRPGEGTQFTLAIPLASSESSLPAATALAKGSRTADARILIVDDEVSVVEGLEQILSLDGYNCRSLYQAAGVIEEIQTFAPDLLILDVGLPDMSGLDLYATVHARWPELKVIFSSGHAAEQDAGVPADRNLVRFLTKPYSIESLEEALEEMLRATSLTANG